MNDNVRILLHTSPSATTTVRISFASSPRIISEQKTLEEEYASLIMKRGGLKGLMHKKEFQNVQQQIQAIAMKLRESNKALCRNLKENPEKVSNMLKMQAERGRVGEPRESLQHAQDAGGKGTGGSWGCIAGGGGRGGTRRRVPQMWNGHAVSSGSGGKKR